MEPVSISILMIIYTQLSHSYIRASSNRVVFITLQSIWEIGGVTFGFHSKMCFEIRVGIDESVRESLMHEVSWWCELQKGL
jgi:hypothetical protein